MSKNISKNNQIVADDLEESDFHVVEYLQTPEEMAAYLTIVREEHPGDSGYFIYALGNVVRAQNMMSSAAANAGKGRTSLYKSLSAEGRPAFETIECVLDTLGLEFVVRAKSGSTR